MVSNDFLLILYFQISTNVRQRMEVVNKLASTGKATTPANAQTSVQSKMLTTSRNALVGGNSSPATVNVSGLNGMKYLLFLLLCTSQKQLSRNDETS